jgi:hypothetical protein
MYEHGRIPARQYQVRFSRQMLVVKAIPEAGAPQIFPYEELRARVLAPDA